MSLGYGFGGVGGEGDRYFCSECVEVSVECMLGGGVHALGGGGDFASSAAHLWGGTAGEGGMEGWRDGGWGNRVTTTIRPCLCWRMAGRAARVNSMGANTFTSNRAWNPTLIPTHLLIEEGGGGGG